MEKQVDPTPSDAELVMRIASGDALAEDELVGRLSRVVRIILRQLLRGSADAEDLFQETFCLLIGKIRRGEVRYPDKISSFAGSLARNVAINHFRVRTRRRTDEDSEMMERIAAVAPTPLHRVVAAERSTLIRRLINELPTDRDRQLLLRFYLADEDKADICRDLALDSLHFNRVLHRARQRLKQLYDRQRQQAGAKLTALLLLLAASWTPAAGVPLSTQPGSTIHGSR